MAQQIKLKRSAVSGKVPTTAQLQTGELAINTSDGKLFFKRDDDTIQTIVTTNTLVTGSLNIFGPVTGSDTYIDGWGSVSASLAQIEVTASEVATLDQVITAGNSTTGDIIANNFATLTGTGYMTAGRFVKKGLSSTGIYFNSSTWSAFSESIDIQLGSSASPLVMYRDNAPTSPGVQESTTAIWNDNAGDFDFLIKASGSGASLRITSSGPGEENTLAKFGGHISSSDVAIDEWGSVSASLSAIQDGVGAVSLQAVTETGNTTTVDVEFQGTLEVGPSGIISTYGRNIAFNGTGTSPFNELGLASIPSSSLAGTYFPQLNVAIGTSVLGNVTASSNVGGMQGSANTGVGHGALGSTTTGRWNTAVGLSALSANTTGDGNTAFGIDALQSVTTRGKNTAVGYSAMRALVSGSDNIALGQRAFYLLTSGSNNIGIGPNVAVNNTSAHDSIFIGELTRPAGNEEYNQIVIGHQAVGKGSNTVTIGNSDTTDNYFFGNISGSDTYIDDWGSVSASLASIQSGVSTADLQSVTDVGNTTTNDIFVSSSKSYYLGANSYLRRETNGGGFERIQLNGSIWLQPNTSANANNGVVIGGNGYLLSANSSRNAQLNYGGVSGQFGVYRLNVYGNDSTFQHDVNVLGSITGSDISIDEWGSVSASLANIGITAANNLYTSNGTLSGNRTVNGGSNSINFTNLSSFGIANSPISLEGPLYLGASIPAATGSALDNTLYIDTVSGEVKYGSSPTLDSVTGNGSSTTNDISIGSLTVGSGENITFTGNAALQTNNNSFTLDADVNANGAGFIDLRTSNVTRAQVNNTGLTVTGDLDANDVTIDEWGSISASLANIEVTAAGVPTLDQVTSQGNTTTNSITVQDLTVNGTGSFAYIESVTGSAKIIGDAYIVLNANAPSERYAGIKVYDSGSTGETGSLEYDSVANHWFYESVNEGYSAVLMSGPKASRGSLSVPTSGSLVLAVGNHLYSSNVSDLDGQVTIDSDAVINGDITHDTYSVLQSGKVTVNNSATGIIGGTYSGTTYAGAVVDYVLYDGSRSSQRTGTVLVTANSTTVVHSENVTTDIGNTDGAEITTTIGSGNFRVNLVNGTGVTMYVTYNIKLLKV